MSNKNCCINCGKLNKYMILILIEIILFFATIFIKIPSKIFFVNDRFTNHTRCFYNMEYIKQPFTTLYPLYKGEVSKPGCFPAMKKIAGI